MIRIRKSQAGFTLIEIIAALAITGILFAAAATAFSAFFSKYEELHLVSDLQKQAYDCLQQGLKYGMIRSETINNVPSKAWYGIANADSVAFLNGGPNGASGIILRMERQSVETSLNYVKFWFDGSSVRGDYLSGQVHPPPADTYIFPKRSRNNKITVTNLRFRQINNSTPAKVIQVDLSAKVEIRKRVYRYVNYTTNMAINKM